MSVELSQDAIISGLQQRVGKTCIAIFLLHVHGKKKNSKDASPVDMQLTRPARFESIHEKPASWSASQKLGCAKELFRVTDVSL